MVDGTINFFRGHPTNELLASHYVLKASEIVLGPKYRPEDDDEEDRHPLTYGSDPGSLTVRKKIAEWTNPADSSVDPNSINLTNGASFGAANALLQCTAAHSGYTRQAFIVSPTYFLINSVFLDAGFAGKLSPVEQRADGSLDLIHLEKLLINFEEAVGDHQVSLEEGTRAIRDESRSQPRKIYRYVMYLVPTFSNPRGGVIPLEDRIELLKLARKYDILLLCDDVYDYLFYNKNSLEELPPRFVTLDRELLKESKELNKNYPGNTISNCTFSKIVGPGLRVGWQETVSPFLAQQLCSGGAVRSGGTPAHLNSMIVGALLSEGYIEKILDELREVYGRRSSAMRQAFLKYLPKGTQIEGGEGGYFYWITLPSEYDGPAICAECAKRGVILAHAVNFQVDDGEVSKQLLNNNSFRICFAYHNVEESDKGIKIWGEAAEELKKN